MQKSTIADMMRYRATELRLNSLEGNSKMSSGQCALILMEYVKLLEVDDNMHIPTPRHGRYE